MKEAKKILVGKIVAPQGIRGDVRVQTYTSKPDDLREMSVLSNRFSGKEFKFIRRLNPTSDVIIAHINGIDDRNLAETLRGTELFICRDSLPDIADDEFYQADLIGFEVFRANQKIGIVDCFQNFGAGDIIELNNGDMVSFLGACVDFDSKRIYVK